MGRLFRSYRPANAIMKNRGHDIELKWHEDAGSIQIDGNHYHLTQLHWHSPSEHTINGRRFAMEMHMVHQTQDGKNIAFIGFLYKYGRPDKLLDELEPYIKEIANKNNEEEWVGIVDPRKIKLGSRKYYRYMGSLTVPPCTEGVVWTIVKKIRTVSKDQVHLLKDAVHEEAHDNSRPLQSIYDSTVLLLKGFCLIMAILWENVGEAVHFGDFANGLFGVYWVNEGYIIGAFLEGGAKDEYEAMSKVVKTRAKVSNVRELEKPESGFA